MQKTIGEKIKAYRKQSGMTQDELAEKMGVSPQAVSKWETDLSIPDLPVLIALCDFFAISLDELVRDKEPAARLVPADKRKNAEEMLVCVRVHSADGDRVHINLPLALVKMAAEMKLELPRFKGSEMLERLDIPALLSVIESGVMGKLVEVESKEGDTVEIWVEA